MMHTVSPTEEIWDTFHARLWQFICAHVADESLAEDILQTVFLTVHQRLNDVRDETRVTSWLFQITRHAIADAYRQRQNLPLPDDAADRFIAAPEATPDLFQEMVPCLHGLLPCLSPEDQEAIRLADLDGVPQRDLAIRWGMSFSGAKSRIQRARVRLKAQLMTWCHIEINRRGVPVAFEHECQHCADASPAPASFADLPRLWDAHSECATSSHQRSTNMDTTETTETTETTATTTSTPTGGFQKPVTIPVTAATSAGCCGAPAADGGTCCGEPVSQVTDTTASGTDSCCGEGASSGGCCN